MSDEWKSIDNPPADGIILIYFGERDWPELHTQDLTRREAMRTEVAFCSGRDIFDPLTGHSVFEPFRKKQGETPTHWKPLTSPKKKKRGPGKAKPGRLG